MSLQLDDPMLYADEVRRLAGRASEAGNGIELSAPLLARHAERVGALLAQEVPRGDYRVHPLQAHTALLGGKLRTIHRLDPLDAVVFGACARVLSSALEPRLGGHLFSYRKGHSQWTACRAFLRYLRTHTAARSDPRQRGLFVLRRDVRRYGESIPVASTSSLWSTLDALLGAGVPGFRGDLSSFLGGLLCPPVLSEDGAAQPLPVGVPTGLPTQVIACNVYLLPLDRELLAIGGGFYARFGDDLLFAHPERAAADHAAELLAAGIERLGLQFNPQKSQAFWLTAPGRPHPDALGYTPVSRVPYLGFDVGFAGAQLRADKRRELWLSLRRRIRHTNQLVGIVSDEERAAILCDVIRTALDRRSPLSERYAPWLAFDVMSRADLVQLDHHLALHVAQCATGMRGVRAFRRFSPQRLRAQFGLPSLLCAWDEARRRGRHGA